MWLAVSGKERFYCCTLVVFIKYVSNWWKLHVKGIMYHFLQTISVDVKGKKIMISLLVWYEVISTRTNLNYVKNKYWTNHAGLFNLNHNSQITNRIFTERFLCLSKENSE